MSLSDTFAGISGKPGQRVSGSLSQRVSAPAVKGGKWTDPEWKAVKVFLRKRTHKAVKLKLLEEDGGDLSELVEGFLAEWLKK